MTGEPVGVAVLGPGRAVAQLNLPPCTMVVDGENVGSALISLDGRCRWWLTRRWQKEGARVCWVMLNPSTADASADDPTLRRCIHFSRSWGYGGLVVVNLYPFRTPDPRELRRLAAWEKHGPDYATRDDMLSNAQVVRRTALQVEREGGIVVAAWGAGAWDEGWVEHVVEQLERDVAHPPTLYCLGVTSSGAPKHPLARGVHRVPDDQNAVPWMRAR